MQYLTKTRLTALLFALGGLLASQAAVAGPWVKAPGETYLKATGSYYASDQVYDVDANLVDPDYEYSHRALGVYGELGFAPRVAFQFSTSFLAAQNELNDRIRYKRTGPSDLDLGLQYQIWSDGCALSASAAVRVPLYEDGVSSDTTAGPMTSGSTAENRFSPALGDGSVDLMPRAHFGCSLHPFPGWFTVMAGPRIRFDGFGNGIDYGVGVGAFLWPDHLALTARAGGTQRFSGDNQSPTKSYLTVAGGLLVKIYSGLAFEAGASYIPVGAFVARGWSASAGFSFTGQIFENPYN